MNILLIEPDDIMRSLIQAALERDGFRVMPVKNNREGLTVSDAMPVDLVVAQFLNETDVAESADLLVGLGARSPWFKLVAVISGFRTRATTLTSLRRILNPWRRVDLTQGGHVVIDACRAAAKERPQSAPSLALNEQAL